MWCSRSAQASSWRITKDHWSAEDEAGFGRFVPALGESNCSSSQSCLRDPANPYRKTDQHFLDIDVDCAKLPYLLRAYYAWKNGLPMSYVDGVSGEGGDLRFTKTANRATGRHDIIDRGDGIDAPARSFRCWTWFSPALTAPTRRRSAACCRISIRPRCSPERSSPAR